jgi:hypothetical protein
LDDCVDGAFVDDCDSPAFAALPPMASFRPGWISEGSEPITERLSE